MNAPLGPSERERLGTIAVDYRLYDPQWTGQRLIPKRVVIETVFGCNARCGMCIIGQETERPKGVMSMETFRSVIDRLAPYKDKVEMFDLFGLGEPLLDPLLFDRIRYVREKGFRRLSYATNCHLLTPERQQATLDSGIETVIFSIDGVRRETVETIRPRVAFDRVEAFTREIVERRNRGGYATRFVVRFTRQKANAEEWEPFRNYWNALLSKERGDVVYCYDVHGWSGQANLDLAVAGAAEAPADPLLEARACHHAFEKLVILANGAVALCFEDILEAQFRFGNVADADPVDIFNSTRFNRIRKLHADGRRTNLKICRECKVLENEPRRIVG